MKKTESEKNRDDAYAELQPKLGLKQKTVYDLIDYYGPSTITEIARKMVLETNNISARIRDLERRCLVVSSGSKQNSKTKVKNTIWRITTPGEREFIRQDKMQSLSEKAVHLAVDLGNVASAEAINLISKEIFRTDQKLALLI